MDPRLLKLMGITFQTPYAGDDGEGGGGGDADAVDGDDGDEDTSDDEDEDADDDESEDGDEDEEDDEDSDEDDDEEDEESDDESEEDDEDFKKLSQRTTKRIKKLVGEVKDLKQQLEEARKLGGEDGQAILSAATTAGVMPRLLTKEQAKGLGDLSEKKSALEYFRDLLESDEDEFEIGGTTYSRRKLERKERTLTEEIHSLEARYGSVRDKAVEKARDLFELGLAAQKAGWKPGKKGETKKLKTDKPKKTASHKKGGKPNVSWEDVEDDDSLEAAIMANRRKKGR